MTIVPAHVSPPLCFVCKGTAPTAFEIVAYAIDGETARPICYPIPPAKARIYQHTSGHYQPFDLNTGLPSGAVQSSITWE